jgi:hypothetical protein
MEFSGQLHAPVAFTSRNTCYHSMRFCGSQTRVDMVAEIPGRPAGNQVTILTALSLGTRNKILLSFTHSYLMDIGGYYPRGNAAGVWSWPLTSI